MLRIARLVAQPILFRGGRAGPGLCQRHLADNAARHLTAGADAAVDDKMVCDTFHACDEQPAQYPVAFSADFVCAVKFTNVSTDG